MVTETGTENQSLCMYYVVSLYVFHILFEEPFSLLLSVLMSTFETFYRTKSKVLIGIVVSFLLHPTFNEYIFAPSLLRCWLLIQFFVRRQEIDFFLSVFGV